MKIVNAEDVAPDVEPVCPHCEKTIEMIVRISDEKGWFQGHLGYCYVCPHCRKILGFSDYSSS